MSISKRDQKLLFILLGIVVFLIAYLGIAKSYNVRKDAVQAQIDSLTPRLTELRGYAANMNTYQDGISQIESSVSASLSKFPIDVRSEDMILYANELQSAIGLNVNGISLTSPELISQFSIPKKDAGDFKLVPVAAMRTGLTITCTSTYDQLKKLFDYINATPEKTTLSRVSISYDSTSARLISSVEMEKYFISSENYTYDPTYTPYVKGAANLFGTFTTPSTSTTSTTSSKTTSGTTTGTTGN